MASTLKSDPKIDPLNDRKIREAKYGHMVSDHKQRKALKILRQQKAAEHKAKKAAA
jgi:hypothetical protein